MILLLPLLRVLTSKDISEQNPWRVIGYIRVRGLTGSEESPLTAVVEVAEFFLDFGDCVSDSVALVLNGFD